MKIRTDFVTNSSSSSFILAFNSSDDIRGIVSDVVECYMSCCKLEDYKRYKPRAITELMGSLKKPIDTKQIADIVRKEYQWNAVYHVEDKYEREHWCSYSEAIEYRKSDEGQAAIEQLIVKEIDRVKDKIANKDLVYLVSFGDDDPVGGQLEHYILPSCDFTAGVYSHH